MRAAFKKAQLKPAIRLIDIGHADLIGPAIIAGEDNQRIIVEALIF
jgi:hypothetical protein